MKEIAFKDTKGIDRKVDKYVKKVEEEGGAITIAGLSRALGITPKTFKEYANGLIPNATPEVIAKFQDIYLMCQEFLEETCLGVKGGKNSGAGAKFLLSNHYGMSDKASVDVDGGLAIYNKINADSDKIVEEVADDVQEEIERSLRKGGK